MRPGSWPCAVAAGVPAEEAAALADLFIKVLDGRNASVSDDVVPCSVDPPPTSQRSSGGQPALPGPGNGTRPGSPVGPARERRAVVRVGHRGLHQVRRRQRVLYGLAFVMRGLDATRPNAAVAAMQEINRAAPRAPLTVRFARHRPALRAAGRARGQRRARRRLPGGC